MITDLLIFYLRSSDRRGPWSGVMLIVLLTAGFIFCMLYLQQDIDLINYGYLESQN